MILEIGDIVRVKGDESLKEYTVYQYMNDTEIIILDMTEKITRLLDRNELEFVRKSKESPFKNMKKESFGKEQNENTSENSLKEEIYESVDHPTHYHPGDYEAIKVIEAWLGPEGCYAFCLSNSIKYISRLDCKPSHNKSKSEKTIEDIDKAIWYLNYAKEMKLKIKVK